MKHFLLAGWAVTAVFALSNSPTPLYVHWQHAMGFSAGTLTVVFAAYIVGLVLALLIAGQAADRFGRKQVVIPGIAIALASAVLFLNASDLFVLLLARLLTGIAVGVVVSAGMAAVVDLGGEPRRNISAMIASIAMVLGAGLGPLISGFIVETSNNPVGWVFGVNIVLLLSALLGYIRLPMPRPTVRRGSSRLVPRLPSVPRANRAHVGSGIGVFGPGLTSTSFVLALGPSLLLLSVGNASPLLAGGAACLMFMAATGTQLILTRLPSHRLFALSTTSTVLAMICVGLVIATKSPLLFVATAIFAGSAQGLGQLGGLRLIAHHVPSARRAEANAALNIGGYLPAAVLTVATGYSVTAFGMPAAATALAVIVGIAAILAGLVAYKTAARE